MRTAIWERAAAVQTGNDWAILCHGSGDACVVGRLARASRLTLSHDAGLAACTTTVNRILESVSAENRDLSRCLKFVVTEYGPMLAWTACSADGESRQSGGGITPENDHATFHRALGLSVESRQAQKGHWETHEDGWIYCHAKKKGQYHCRLLQPETPSSVFDARLAECTNQINTIFEARVKEKNDPRLELCLLATPPGLLLAWTRDAHSEDSAGPGAVTADSEEDAIYRALGLARPSGGPPWKVILPVAAVGAAGAGIVIAIAAGVFSGGDGSSPVDGTPSATAPATEALGTGRPPATRTPQPETGVPPDATATTGVEPTSPAGPTLEPTVPLEPTSNLEPTRQPTRPAATRTPNVPPQT